MLMRNDPLPETWPTPRQVTVPGTPAPAPVPVTPAPGTPAPPTVNVPGSPGSREAQLNQPQWSNMAPFSTNKGVPAQAGQANDFQNMIYQMMLGGGGGGNGMPVFPGGIGGLFDGGGKGSGSGGGLSTLLPDIQNMWGGTLDRLTQPADYNTVMQMFDPIKQQMENQVNQASAQTLEQFGNMGTQYGSGAITGVANTQIEGANQMNSILSQMWQAERQREMQGLSTVAGLGGQLDAAQLAAQNQWNLGQLGLAGQLYSTQADLYNQQMNRQFQGASQLGQNLYGSQEAAAGRMYDLIGTLLNYQQGTQQNAMGVAGLLQNMDQSNINAMYQEWLRQQSGYRPEMLNFLGASGSPQYANEQYQPGFMDQLLPIAGNIGTMAAMAHFFPLMLSHSSFKNIKGAANTSEILRKVLKLPISEWTYKGSGVPHIGPMADDFNELFGYGFDEHAIEVIDALGVLFAAVQALAERIGALEVTNG